jgi:hypothetical protein
MRQDNEKSQVNSVSHRLLNMEMKADKAMLGIPTLPLKQIPVQACYESR